VRPRFSALIFGLLSVTGCTDPNAPIKTSAGKLTQAEVDAIIAKCGGLPGLAVIKVNKLVIYPAKDISITGCVLGALQATGQTTLSSVGNKRYDPPQEQ
jgi:hypothetical protein